jgi:hypothetical protein
VGGGTEKEMYLLFIMKVLNKFAFALFAIFFMLISFSMCKLLPDANIIHRGKILSLSKSTGCYSPASHRGGCQCQILSGRIIVAHTR